MHAQSNLQHSWPALCPKRPRASSLPRPEALPTQHRRAPPVCALCACKHGREWVFSLASALTCPSAGTLLRPLAWSTSCSLLVPLAWSTSCSADIGTTHALLLVRRGFHSPRDPFIDEFLIRRQKRMDCEGIYQGSSRPLEPQEQGYLASGVVGYPGKESGSMSGESGEEGGRRSCRPTPRTKGVRALGGSGGV